MLLVIVVVLLTGALCFAAVELGQRSDGWSLALSPLLVMGAWRLANLRTTQGEGAASGVVVVQAGIWYAAVVCGLLALILLGTSFYMRRSPAIAGMVLVVVLVLGYRLAATQRAAATPEAPKDIAAPRESYLEGYAWAVDSGIDTVALCVQGSAAFIDGCKHAARRQRPR